MKKIRTEMIKLFILSGIAFVILLCILYKSVTDFIIKQEVQKAKLVAHTLVYTRQYLSKVSPYVEIKNKHFHPFSMTPAYAVSKIAILLRKNEDIYVKQTSDKYRDIHNKPDAQELKAIKYLEKHKKQKEFYEVDKNGNKASNHIFYAYPLKVTKSCMKCHGPINTISKPLLHKLQKYYKNRAFGYKVGELRGIIAVRIPFNDVQKNVNKLFVNFAIFLFLLYLGGIYFFIRLNKLILKDIDTIDNYLQNNLSKNIYRPFKEKINFFELNIIKEALNNVVKSLKKHKKESFENLYYNPITKLANRKKMLETIKSERPIIVLDMDSFKDLNYLYGEKIANELIIAATNRLKDYKLFHTKIDQFAILVNKDITKEDILKLAKKLIAILESVYTIRELSIVVKFRAGISYTKKDFLRALSALDYTRRVNKDVAFCSEADVLREKYKEHLKWFKKIKEALEDDRIVPFYQPILDTNKKINKYEALVRLIDIDGKIISPFFFLEIAKKSRVYFDITKSMINQVIKKLETSPVPISVNLTTLDIENKEIREFIIDKLNKLEYPEKIHFEIVESEDIKESEHANEFINKLKSYGCKILIDDFGSGYANFDYLLSLGADAIKVDGSLIKNILKDKNSKIVLKTILSFAKEVNMQVIAEYVEDYEVYNYLKEKGVDLFQGYFYSPPKEDLE